MPRPPEVRRPELLRFTPAERWVHRTTGLLMGVCLLTAAVLYLSPVEQLVGRRALVANVHLIAGIGLPVPSLLGLLSRAFRADLRLLDRFAPVDRVWLRAKDRRTARLPVGKFNAGQKLNAAVVAGASLVMLGTGLVMRFANAWPTEYRTGATFVHDWVAYGTTALVFGHIWFAMRDAHARDGMRTGYVPRTWARREHPAWAADLLGADPTVEEPAADGPDVAAPPAPAPRA